MALERPPLVVCLGCPIMAVLPGDASPRWELVTSDRVPLRNVPAAVGRISVFHGAASPVGCYSTCVRDLYTWLLLLDCAVAAHVHSQQLGLCLDETPLQGRSIYMYISLYASACNMSAECWVSGSHLAPRAEYLVCRIQQNIVIL